MLYTTTRSNRDAYTAHRALHENVAPDGGRFVPFRFPQFCTDELAAMCQKSPNENIADILNVFFAARLSGWDIDFCIGRNAVRLKIMTHKITVAELWHNAGAEFDFIVKNLYGKIATDSASAEPSEWFVIAVRIALYFAIYCEQCRQAYVATGDEIDISVPDDGGTSLMAACYAKRMGLPVGTIICTSVDSPILWDLVHRGEVATTGIGDVGRLGVERFLQHIGGFDAVSDWQKATADRSIFSFCQDKENPMDFGVYCVVTGANRCNHTINSIFRGNGYIVDPFTAVCFAGLQDYRTQSTTGRPALVLAEHSPLKFADKIAVVTGISADKISVYIDN